MSAFETIQTAEKARLDADPWFQDASGSPTPKPITVMVHRIGDLYAEVVEAMSQSTLLVILYPLRITGPGDSPSVAFNGEIIPTVIFQEIEVVENAVLNRALPGTPQPGDLVGDKLIKSFCGWSPAPALGMAKFHLSEFVSANEHPLLIHRITLAAKTQWKPQ